jgi:MoxR-like ATPase
MPSLFDAFGVCGWESIQFPVLSALIARIPILFVGDHGAFKTEGAKLLSQLVLGTRCKFRSYDTAVITNEDLLGIPDPASLRADSQVVRYIPTELSVWGKDAINLDEINLASPFVASKLHELVRVRKVMGQRTGVKLVFSSMNPPADYGTQFLNHAFASRFATIRVPSVWEMEKSAKVGIIRGHSKASVKRDAESARKLRLAIRKAKVIVAEALFSEKDQDKTASLVTKILNVVGPTAATRDFRAVRLSGRQIEYMNRLMLGVEAFRIVAEHDSINFKIPADAFIKCALAVMPDAQGVVRGSVDPVPVMARLAPLITGFQLNDPLVTRDTLTALAASEIADATAWLSAMEEEIDTSTEFRDLALAYVELTAKRDKKQSVALDDLDLLRKNILTKAASLKFGPASLVSAKEVQRFLEAFKHPGKTVKKTKTVGGGHEKRLKEVLNVD